MRVVISGGGTGGHIFPAIAIADALRKQDPAVEILFVGAQGRMEMEKVPAAGYRIEGLWISGFQRSLTKQNLLFPVKVISSLWKARQIVRQFKPDVAVGVGGYASGPTLRVANWMGIPTVLQEQNSYAGVTNKLLAQKAAVICVAYDRMERFFPKEKIRLTGNPVRSDIFGLDKRAEGMDFFGLDPTKKTIVILGGSLGARTLNQAMDAAAGLLAQKEDVQVLWQCGKVNFEMFSKIETAKLPRVKIRAFIEKMELAYSVADVIIARAGALTISELCLVGKAAILVPSPNVAEDHQTKNALSLVEKEAALMVPDSEAKGKMIPLALELLQDDQKRQILRENCLKLARPNAAQDIAKEIIRIAKRE